MILLDANVLLYAHDETSSHHRAVQPWLQQLLNGQTEVGIPWLTMWAFLRIATNSRISQTAVEPREAIRRLQDLLAWPRVRVVEPGPNHIRILEDLIVEGQVSGARVTDAALAALAIEHGATLASTDRDFSRFADLRWINPLAAS